MDWLCLPQGSFSVPVTDFYHTEEYFQQTLSKCYMLFLGLTVFAIWHEKAWSRFWPCFEVWLAMQDATPEGLRLSSGQCSRLHLAYSDAKGIAHTASGEAMIEQMRGVQTLREEWGRIRPDEESGGLEAENIASNPSAGRPMMIIKELRTSYGSLCVDSLCHKLGTGQKYAVTKLRDKSVALNSLHDFSDQYAKLYMEFSDGAICAGTASRYVHQKSMLARRSSGITHASRRPDNANTGYLLKELAMLAYETSCCKCELEASSDCDCTWKDPILYLLEKRADINGQMLGGDTPLLIATRLGQTRLVKFLLSQRADVKQSADRQHWTALHEAIRMGRTEMCRVLLGKWGRHRQTGDDKDADASIAMHPSSVRDYLPNLRCKAGSTPLLDAAGGGIVDIVEELLRSYGDANIKLPNGTTALMKAVANGDAEVCKVFIDGVQMPSGQSSRSYLCRGCSKEHFKPCTVRCTNRVHLPVVDSYGNSALSLARDAARDSQRYVEVVKLLNKRGVR
jgi:ankyrin repeat protein